MIDRTSAVVVRGDLSARRPEGRSAKRIRIAETMAFWLMVTGIVVDHFAKAFTRKSNASR